MSVPNNPNYPLYGTNDGPWAEIDGIPFPLAEQSLVEGGALNPFSPANQDGNSAQVVSQRHASEIWDDWTGGVGFRDNEPGSHQYAHGNMDARFPGQLTVPPLAGNIGSGAAAATPYTGSHVPVRAAFLQDNSGAYDFITWSQRNNLTTDAGIVRGIRNSTVRTVGVPDTDQWRGFAEYNTAWYLLTNNGTDTKLWTMNTIGGAFTVVLTSAFTSYAGLVQYDEKLITFAPNAGGAGSLKQYSGGAWVAYIGGWTPLSGTETFRDLFVWTDKSGSRDALYALTTRRLLVYDEEGQQWETLYNFGEISISPWSRAHVNKRDNTLMLALLTSLSAANITPTGNIFSFTPGTVDNVPINKGLGYGTTVSYGGPFNAPPTAYPSTLASGVHWLFAFCYATGGGAGLNGGVFAYNEFGGWTQLFDPVVVGGAGRSLVGGGYGGGYLLTLLDNGAFHITYVPDANIDHPQGTYDSFTAAHTYYLRSGRIFNRQKNVLKIGSHAEITFKDVIPAGSTVTFKWRYYNENGLSAFVTSSAFPTGSKRVTVTLSDGAASRGIHYYYAEWEINATHSNTVNTPPVIESVVWYYTYWQENHFSYQYMVDLTTATWESWGADANFGGYTREYLQEKLLSLLDDRQYHTFAYARGHITETVTRADILLARRESADDASGMYIVTVRDLEHDTVTGTTHAIVS